MPQKIGQNRHLRPPWACTANFLFLALSIVLSLGPHSRVMPRPWWASYPFMWGKIHSFTTSLFEGLAIFELLTLYGLCQLLGTSIWHVLLSFG